MKFIHLSDLHFHSHPSYNKEIVKIFKKIKDGFFDHYIIVTGDIVNDGHKDQYRQAFETLKDFKGRIFICPGNHDFAEAGDKYSEKRAARFDEYLAKPLDQGGTFIGQNSPVVNVLTKNNVRLMLIALNTNPETDEPFDYASGQVGEEQLEALKSILYREPADVIKILFFHHHPFEQYHPFMYLRDAEELWRIIYQRIHVLLFGHKHVSQQWENFGGIHYILRSDNSPGKDFAREITVEPGTISIADVLIA